MIGKRRQLPIFGEATFDAAHRKRSVVPTLCIVLTAEDNLNRARDLFGYHERVYDVVGDQTSSETATQKRRMHMHVIP